MQRHLELSSGNLYINQSPNLGLGGSVWDAALSLAYFLDEKHIHSILHYAALLPPSLINLTSQDRQNLIGQKSTADLFWNGQHVCELGSGTGICGLVVALHGPERVLLTDLSPFLPLINSNIKQNEHLWNSNKVKVVSIEHNWGTDTSPLSPPFNVILISDCIYEPVTYPLLVSSLSSLSSTFTLTLLSWEKRKKRELGFFTLLSAEFDYVKVDDIYVPEEVRCDEIGIFLIWKKTDNNIDESEEMANLFIRRSELLEKRRYATAEFMVGFPNEHLYATKEEKKAAET